MSGVESWAMVAPSTNSTMPCTIDCGCTTTSMRSKSTPNSSCASMTSSPLFISVDESIVILAPIVQVGCRSASARVTVASSAAVRPRNGPPLAVRMMRPTSVWRPDRRHCQIAECSESTGTISPPPAARALATTGPGRDQALLVGEREPLAGFEAPIVAGKPGEADDRVEHDVGVGMRGELGQHLRECRDTRRARSLGTPNARACSASSSTLLPAASATTR